MNTMRVLGSVPPLVAAKGDPAYQGAVTLFVKTRASGWLQPHAFVMQILFCIIAETIQSTTERWIQ